MNITRVKIYLLQEILCLILSSVIEDVLHLFDNVVEYIIILILFDMICQAGERPPADGDRVRADERLSCHPRTVAYVWRSVSRKVSEFCFLPILI